VPPVPVEAGHVTVSLAPVLLQIMAAELPGKIDMDTKNYGI
jgi:hypothetical protein